METELSVPTLAGLSTQQREQAMQRFAIVRRCVEEGLSRGHVAQECHVALRTLDHWLSLYRRDGLVGLARTPRRDRGTYQRLTVEQIHLIEGQALQTPKPSMATVHRQVTQVAQQQGWDPPSYAQVKRIIKHLSPAVMTLAHAGEKAYRETFDVIARHEARHPNAVWQADHTLLDLWILNDAGIPAQPWLTCILDDYSRAVAGYLFSFQAPSAAQTALALRRAIWRKEDPRWHVWGIPDVLYTDHGSDFTSQHLEQVAADLKILLHFSWPGVPRGRGKIERFFATVNQTFLTTVPGYAVLGAPKPQATLTLPQCEQCFHTWLLTEYHVRQHTGIKDAPQARWETSGFLPRIPVSLEQLDLLLLTVRKVRRIHQDGVYFQGYRYFDLMFAAYVGEEVMIRYDPTDMAEIRVYYQDSFLCRAICAELAGAQVSLKDLITARTQQRRSVRTHLHERQQVAKGVLHDVKPLERFTPPTPLPAPPTSPSLLKRYRHE